MMIPFLYSSIRQVFSGLRTNVVATFSTIAGLLTTIPGLKSS